MPINRDLSDLPQGDGERMDGHPPDPQSRFGNILVDLWLAEERARVVPRATESARFRHSDAGACARAIGYAALDLPATNPIDGAGVVTTTIGTWVHTELQRALEKRYGRAAEIELKVGTGERAGHIDAVIRWRDADGTDRVTAVEFKTVGGYAWKMAIGVPPAARVPQGPKYEHILQAALCGYEVAADEVVVVYLSKEAISVNIAKDRGLDEYQRVTREWTFPREVYEPLAIAEADRVDKILGLLDAGELPRRIIPDPSLPKGHLIVHPATGAYTVTDQDGTVIDGGSYWGCGYCKWQDLCATTAATRVPVEEVKK